MSLVVFGVAGVCVWALCWSPLARLWPTEWATRRDPIRDPARDIEPGPGQVGGMAYTAGPLRRVRVRAGAREWAPVVATVVAFAVSWATGGLFS